MVKIMSMEHEYGLAHKSKIDHQALAWEIYSSANDFVLAENRDNYSLPRKHLKNGSQIYVDLGHIEIALPECSNPKDTVLYDRASSHIIKNIAERKLIKVFKNNLDSRGASFGCHENYFLDAELLRENLKIPYRNQTEDFHSLCISKISPLLIPFLITRPIISGSGYISKNKYLLSQRATTIKEEVSINTTKDRAIINERNEPFSKTGIRLHLISGDSNMSEFTNYLKLGATSLILTMIEHNKNLPEVKIENPVRVLEEINNKDIKSKITGLKMLEKIPCSPLKIQRAYLKNAKEFFTDSKISPPWAEDVLNKWEFVLSSLEEEPFSLNRHIDWVIKKFLITEYIKSNKIKIYDERAKKIDLCYHLFSNNGGFESYSHLLNLEKIITKEETEAAINNPPNDTRAYGRTKILEILVAKKSKRINFSWDTVAYNRERINLPEPYEPYASLILDIY